METVLVEKRFILTVVATELPRWIVGRWQEITATDCSTELFDFIPRVCVCGWVFVCVWWPEGRGSDRGKENVMKFTKGGPKLSGMDSRSIWHRYLLKMRLERSRE